MVDEKGDRIPGLASDAEILAHPERHSKAVMQQTFIARPEFCSACHKGELAEALNDYKWMRAFTAYDEWQNSKFSKRNPLTFYSAELSTCQNCHMKREIPTAAGRRCKAGNVCIASLAGRKYRSAVLLRLR